jgi:hypothetical protein
MPNSTPPTEVRLEPPSGFEDLTDYTFRSADELRRLTVQCPPVGKPPEEAIAVYLTCLFEVRDPQPITIERVTVATVPAPGTFILCYTFSEPASVETEDPKLLHMRESCAFALLKDKVGVVVGYAYPADIEKGAGGDTFARVLASIGSISTSAPAGFTRRAVGKIALDIPADLAPPTTYSFATPSADIRLNARVTGPDQPVPQPAYGSADHPVPGATVEKLSSYAVGGEDRMTMYASTRTGSAGSHTDYVCHGVVALPDGTRVSLSGQCRWDLPGAPEQEKDKDERVDRMIRAFENLAASAKGVKS